MKNFLVLLFIFSLLNISLPAQRIYYPDNELSKPDNKNVFSSGLTFGAHGHIDGAISFFLNLEYERILSERFSVGLLLLPSVSYPHHLEDTMEEIYEYTRHLYMYGMAYYRHPVNERLGLRLGIGAGAGYHETPDYNDGINRGKWMPYINVSAQSVVTLSSGNELRFPIFVIAGPSNIAYSFKNLQPWDDNGSWVLGFSFQFVYGVKF